MDKLILITANFPYGKGETFIENEIKTLASSFDFVTIMPQNKTDGIARKLPQNIEVKFLDKNNSKNLLSLFNIYFWKEFFKNLLSKPLKNKVALSTWFRAYNISKQIDIIDKNTIYYSYWLDDSAIALAMLSQKHDIKVVSRAHGWDVYYERHKYNYLPFRYFLGKHLTNVFSISKNGQLYLENKGLKNVELLRLGTIQPNKFVFESRKDTQIVAIANLIPLKRMTLVAKAVKLLYKRNVNIKWHLFGDGLELNNIKKLTKPFGNGFFYHGRLPNNEIKEWLKRNRKNTVLINTSISEGVPVSMMEAMSFGVPCIGTNVGGVSEIIEDGYNGFLMPANPIPKQVADYIEKFINLNIEDKVQMKQNAYQTWKDKYNATKNYSEFTSKLLQL